MGGQGRPEQVGISSCAMWLRFAGCVRCSGATVRAAGFKEDEFCRAGGRESSGFTANAREAAPSGKCAPPRKIHSFILASAEWLMVHQSHILDY